MVPGGWQGSRKVKGSMLRLSVDWVACSRGVGNGRRWRPVTDSFD